MKKEKRNNKEIINVLGHEKIILIGNNSFPIATQLLVPFLYHHNGGEKVKYIEINDCNNDLFFTQSKSIVESFLTTKECANYSDLSLAMTDLGNAVIDLGSLSVDVIEWIGWIGRNKDFDDISWVVCVEAGKKSAQNALTTLNKIQDIYKNYDEDPRILLILNGGADEKDIDFPFVLGNGNNLDFVLKDKVSSFKYILLSIDPYYLDLAFENKKLCFELSEIESEIEEEMHSFVEHNIYIKYGALKKLILN